MPEDELPLYLHWVKFLDWLLSRTEKFPRRMRLSLSNRLENLALDFLQDLVEARYTRDKTATLRRMNLRLEQLRVLLRLCNPNNMNNNIGLRLSSTAQCEWPRFTDRGRVRGLSRSPSGSGSEHAAGYPLRGHGGQRQTGGPRLVIVARCVAVSVGAALSFLVDPARGACDRGTAGAYAGGVESG